VISTSGNSGIDGACHGTPGAKNHARTPNT
jgi:hypothetical protein